MQAQLAALTEIMTFLDRHNIRYVVIGGLANAVWGRPRATLDADLKVLLGDLTIADFVQLLSTSFSFRTADPEAFIRRTYVAPIYASNGIAIDLGLGFLPYEHQVVDRELVQQSDMDG